MKKPLLFIGALIMLFSFTAATTHAADTTPFEEACKNLSDSDKAKSAACSAKDTNTNPISGGTDSLLYKITRIVSMVAGAAAVIIIIIGGISMVTSGGDSQKFQNARNTLIFAAVGLVVIALAQALISLVVNRVAP